MKITLIIAAVLCTVVWAEKARFDYYRVYSVQIETIDQLKIVQQFEEGADGYSLWNDAAIGRTSDIMVPPHKVVDFAELMDILNLEYTLKIENVQKLIDDEQPRNISPMMDWTSYKTYAEIYAWMDELLALYPSILTNINIGYSYENRIIRGLRLSYKEGNPGVFIESHIHAREWITSATATYFLNSLLTSTDPSIRDLAENIDWYIIPVTNVDGFVYTHTTNRLWRKTRQPHGTCYGADPNRNFPFQWMTGGASNNPCSDTYAGPMPLSEPETRQLTEYFNTISSNINIYLSFHSYGQYLLFAYGHTTAQAPSHSTLNNVAQYTVNAIAERYGTRYTYGGIAQTLYVASGGSSDWAYATKGIPLSYTFEFRDTGSNGFVLPAAQIIPNGLELIDGMKAMVQRSRELNIM